MPSFEALSVDDTSNNNSNNGGRSQSRPSPLAALMDFFCGLLASLSALFGRLKPPPTITVNRRRFTVLKQLGEGGFSFVYLVREAAPSHLSTSSHASSTGLYALKRIRIQLPEHEERLRYEIAAHQAVSSPHVLKLIDSETVSAGGAVSEGRLLLPFCSKGTVQDLIDKTPAGEYIPIDTILRIAIDVCKGLTAFHSHSPPLAFRDLKPANILIDDSGRAVLMDLGSVTHARVVIASRKEAVALQELCAETVTAPFRAPELFDPPSNSSISEASDVWALGCTIYAMAFRESPFDGSLTAAVSGRISFPSSSPYGPQFRAVIEGIILNQAAARPTVPQIEQLLTRMLGSVTVNV
ncbi:kinase-like domain-containing protein [Entophlyctis helioformis]|nr:kinase-like domain-containing protein [Entophlyctis helioformis]